jgi:hypothetical protein
MFDSKTDVNVYNAGDSFKFNVDAVSGTLHKSTRKSKLCVRDVNEKSWIFDDEHPRLNGQSDEIVVLQTMLTGGNKILVEYMTRKDYDEMFDGPLPEVNVAEMIRKIKSLVREDISREEDYDRLVKNDEKDDYGQRRWERRWMSEQLAESITKRVCKYLEDKHIGTFDFNNVFFGNDIVLDKDNHPDEKTSGFDS